MPLVFLMLMKDICTSQNKLDFECIQLEKISHFRKHMTVSLALAIRLPCGRPRSCALSAQAFFECSGSGYTD